MNVTSYLFQSPYSSPVQVGRVDPSTKQEESKPQSGGLNAPDMKQNMQEAEAFAASQKKEVLPQVQAPKLLDTYA